MSFLSTIESLWAKDEAWILNFLIGLKQSNDLILADIQSFWAWIAGHSADITTNATMVANVVQAAFVAAGKPVPPAALAAIQGMNQALAGLNAAVAASNAGHSAPDVLIAGYQAAKAASAAVQVAAGAVAAAPPQ